MSLYSYVYMKYSINVDIVASEIYFTHPKTWESASLLSYSNLSEFFILIFAFIYIVIWI